MQANASKHSFFSVAMNFMIHLRYVEKPSSSDCFEPCRLIRFPFSFVMRDCESVVLVPFHQPADRPMDPSCSLSVVIFSCITFLALLGPFSVVLDMNSK